MPERSGGCDRLGPRGNQPVRQLFPWRAARHLLLSRGIDADGGMRSDPNEVVLNDPLNPVLTQGR